MGRHSLDISLLHPNGGWYTKFKTRKELIEHLKFWNKKINPENQDYVTKAEYVQAKRLYALMKTMILRAHGIYVFESNFAGPRVD